METRQLTPAESEKIDALAKKAADIVNGPRTLIKGFAKFAFGATKAVSGVVNAPRKLDPEGCILDAIISGWKAGAQPHADREMALRVLRNAAESGTLAATYPNLTRVELVDQLTKLGMDEKDAIKEANTVFGDVPVKAGTPEAKLAAASS
jgi:hypothetical protein